MKGSNMDKKIQLPDDAISFEGNSMKIDLPADTLPTIKKISFEQNYKIEIIKEQTDIKIVLNESSVDAGLK